MEAKPARLSLEPWKHVHIAKQYEIKKCTKADHDTLLNLFKEFVKYEPIGKDLNMNWEDDFKTIAESYISLALNSPAHLPCAYIAIHKETGKAVALRTMHPIYRDESKNPKAEESKKPSEKAMIIHRILDDLTNRFWTEFPNEQACFHGDILFIDPAHRGKGLVDVFIEFDVDAEVMIKNGFNYAQYELTSMPAKMAARRFNVKIVANSPTFVVCDGKTIPLSDGPLAMGLHNYHDRGSFNAKPHWEKMGLL